MVVILPQDVTAGFTRRAVIDCDIHPALATPNALDAYLPSRWRAHGALQASFGHSGATYPRANQNAARTDSWPPSGAPPGGDLAFMREQLLDDGTSILGSCSHCWCRRSAQPRLRCGDGSRHKPMTHRAVARAGAASARQPGRAVRGWRSRSR